jgi:hypothetical protein
MSQHDPTTSTSVARIEESMRSLAIPRNADDMLGLANRMFKAGMVPQSFKSPEAAFLAMLKGAEYGLLPQQALAAFYVIGNVAYPYGTGLRGIVRASKDFVADREGCAEGMAELRYMCTEENPYKPESVESAMFIELQRALKRRLARAEERASKDKNLPMYFCGWAVVARRDEAPACVLFDSFDAHRGQLLGKDMWQKWPQRMHMHRAGTFARRDNFGDVLIGLDVTVEEALELGAIETTVVEVQKPGAPAAVLSEIGTHGRVLEVTEAPARNVNAPTERGWSNNRGDVGGRDNPGGLANPAAPPAAATGVARDEIYKTAGGAPAHDIPLDSEHKLVEEDNPQDPKQRPSGPVEQPGQAALKAAVTALKAARLDAAAIGRECTEALGLGSARSSDLGDGDKAAVARAMLGKLEALREPAPATDPAEDF